MAKNQTVTGTVHFPIEQIYAALSDQQMWLSPRSGDQSERTEENYDVSVDADGVVTVHISQDLDGGAGPADDSKGISLAVRQVVTVSPPANGEIRQSSFAKVGSIPGDICVETLFTDNGNETTMVTATGSAKLMVPMIGKVINQQFLAGFEKMVTKEIDFMNAYLTEHSSPHL